MHCYPESPEPPRRFGFIRRWTLRLAKASLLLVVLAVPTVYFGVPLGAKTAWARARAERALTRALQTPVQVGEMAFTWRLGLDLAHVVAEPRAYGRLETELEIARLRVKPDWKKLLRGRLELKVAADGPRLALKELKETGSALALPRLRGCCKGIQIRELKVNGATLTFESPAFEEDLRVEGLNLAGSLSLRRDRVEAELASIEAKVNGGSLTGSGSLGLQPAEVRSRIDVTAKDVASGDFTARSLRHLLPLFETLPSGAVKGKVDVRVRAEGAGQDLAAFLRSLQGAGELTVREGDLRGSRILHAARHKLAEVSFHEVQSRFTLLEGRVQIPLAVARGRGGEVRLIGWTAFDGSVEYSIDDGGSTPARVSGKIESPKLLEPSRFF